jgi:hypothetical protein
MAWRGEVANPSVCEPERSGALTREKGTAMAGSVETIEGTAALREQAVRAALTDALAPLRMSTGGYRIEDELRYLIATADPFSEPRRQR